MNNNGNIYTQALSLFLERNEHLRSLNSYYQMTLRNEAFLRKQPSNSFIITFLALAISCFVITLLLFMYGTLAFTGDEIITHSIPSYSLVYSQTMDFYFDSYKPVYIANCVFAALTVFFLVITILLGIPLRIRKKKKTARLKELAVEANTEIKKKAQVHCNMVDNIEAQLASLNILHPVYWNAGDVILNYIILNRATNITEAINLYEHERQVNQQLMQNQMMIDGLQNMQRELKQIKWFSAATAFNTALPRTTHVHVHNWR